MSDIVNKREFIRHAGKYLIPNKSYILKGKPDIIVNIELSDKKQVSDKGMAEVRQPPKERIREVLKTVPEIKTAKEFIPNWQRDTSKYACGCAKTEQSLCLRHNRA